MPPLPPVEGPEEPEASPLPPKKYSSRLSKADSVEELMKSYYSDCNTAKSMTSTKCNGTGTGDSEEADSGRSTPGKHSVFSDCEISLDINVIKLETEIRWQFELGFLLFSLTKLAL